MFCLCIINIPSERESINPLLGRHHNSHQWVQNTLQKADTNLFIVDSSIHRNIKHDIPKLSYQKTFGSVRTKKWTRWRPPKARAAASYLRDDAQVKRISYSGWTSSNGAYVQPEQQQQVSKTKYGGGSVESIKLSIFLYIWIEGARVQCDASGAGPTLSVCWTEADVIALRYAFLLGCY